jgi:YD repeat-containing protein
MGEMVMGSYSEYDENDRLIRSVTVRDGVTLSSSEYAYDEEGHTWRQANYDAEGNLTYAFSYVYENGALLRTVQDNGAYSVVTTYEVDEESGTRTTVTESPSGVTKTVVTVDEAGRPLRQETVSGDTVSLTVYEYDEAGRLLRQTVGDPEAPDSQRICTYVDQGNPLTDVYEERGGYREEIVCEYDYAARKKTETRTTTRPEG